MHGGAGLGGAPYWHGCVALEHHVIGKQIGQRQLRKANRREAEEEKEGAIGHGVSRKDGVPAVARPQDGEDAILPWAIPRPLIVRSQAGRRRICR